MRKKFVKWDLRNYKCSMRRPDRRQPSQLELLNTLIASLQRGKTSPSNECPDYMAPNNLMVKLQ